MSSSPSSSALNASTAVHVEDFKSANDLTLPMVEEMEEVVRVHLSYFEINLLIFLKSLMFDDRLI